MISLTINGRAVEVPEGTTILEAARVLGIDIPTLCYLKELEIVSSCRICVVDVRGWKNPTTACSTLVSEGMEVETESERVVEYRKELLRLYLDNHPNDCLTCQKSGECELQDLSYRYGVEFRDHDGERRKFKQAMFSDTSSPYILRDESKCILCGRCVRTCAKVNRNVLSFANRGFETRIAADADETLEESTCVSCNRCVAACPVGALMDRRAQHKVRNWKKDSELVECKRCEYGCQFELIREKGEDEVLAVKAVGAVSDKTPLCLRGRLTTEFEYVDNPQTPYIKVEGEDGRKFKKASWIEAIEMEGIFDKLKEMEESK